MPGVVTEKIKIEISPVSTRNSKLSFKRNVFKMIINLTTLAKTSSTERVHLASAFVHFPDNFIEIY